MIGVLTSNYVNMIVFLCFDNYFIDAIVQWTYFRVYIASSKYSQIGRILHSFANPRRDWAKILPTPPRDCDKINDYKIFKIVHAL